MGLKKLAEEWQQQHKLNGGHAIKNVSYESVCDGTDCDAACCSYPHQVAALVALLERVRMEAERERDDAREAFRTLYEGMRSPHYEAMRDELRVVEALENWMNTSAQVERELRKVRELLKVFLDAYLDSHADWHRADLKESVEEARALTDNLDPYGDSIVLEEPKINYDPPPKPGSKA